MDCSADFRDDVLHGVLDLFYAGDSGFTFRISYDVLSKLCIALVIARAVSNHARSFSVFALVVAIRSGVRNRLGVMV